MQNEPDTSLNQMIKAAEKRMKIRRGIGLEAWRCKVDIFRIVI